MGVVVDSIYFTTFTYLNKLRGIGGVNIIQKEESSACLVKMYSQAEFGRLYLDVCEETFKNNHNFRLTTITVVCQFDQSIDIVSLYNNIDDDMLNKKLSRNDNDYSYTKRKKIIKVFFNQISISWKDISTKVVKIFTNGKVHITGLSSILDYETTMEYTLEIIKQSISLSDLSVIETSQRMVMVNANLYIGQAINLFTFVDIIGELHQLSKHACAPRIDLVKYCPESYPAVTVKVNCHPKSSEVIRSPSYVTLQVFRTGNVMLSSPSIEEMMIAYSLVHKYLQSSLDSATTNKLPETPPPSPSPYKIHGYSLKDFLIVSSNT